MDLKQNIHQTPQRQPAPSSTPDLAPAGSGDFSWQEHSVSRHRKGSLKSQRASEESASGARRAPHSCPQLWSLAQARPVAPRRWPPRVRVTRPSGSKPSTWGSGCAALGQAWPQPAHATSNEPRPSPAGMAPAAGCPP